MSRYEALIDSMGPELELICLAARVRSCPDENERIRALVDAGLDWSTFLPLLERNYVAPLVQRRFASIRDLAVPARVLETIRVRSRITAWKNELFAKELVRLSQLFEDESIEIIHYKGAVSADQYYGSAALRNFNDLDFLVRRRDVAAVVELLEADGYANPDRFTQDQFEHFVAEFKEFVFQKGEFSIEPHWSVTGRRYPFEADYEGFWRRAQTWKTHGVGVRVLGREDALLVHCLVGAKGRWQRLQMVCDVAECLRSSPNLDWPGVIDMATRSGTVRILHLGLLLAHELSGADLPSHLLGEVRASSVTRHLARDVLKYLKTGPRLRRFLPDSPSVVSPMLFRQRERRQDRWRYVWRTTTTPSVLHMERVPLPKWLHPLYWVVVPVHDYLAIPVRKWLKRG